MEISRMLSHLQEKIKARGFTQREIQEVLGWGPSYVSKLIRRDTALRVDHILMICEVIALAPEELFHAHLPEEERDRSSEKALDELLKSYGHPLHALESVNEQGLLKAAQRRYSYSRGKDRDYLDRVVTWCKNSIETDKRARLRRMAMRPRRGKDAKSTWPSFPPLVWPRFEDPKT
ncbi:MAG: helix-turn-helix transcriptional regulator [bacterium]|nr:helix-turn-helix transcriptional regulator [bacterium]